MKMQLAGVRPDATSASQARPSSAREELYGSLPAGLRVRALCDGGPLEEPVVSTREEGSHSGRSTRASLLLWRLCDLPGHELARHELGSLVEHAPVTPVC